MSIDMLNAATRLGVLGGTFDPIHYGHLALAEEARLQLALDAVLFIPAGEPPHKSSRQAAAEERFLLVSLATADHPHFHVSRLEIDRQGASYTIDTLKTLCALYPHAELFLLLGADAVLDFPQWRAPEKIRQLATVVGATRPGVPLAEDNTDGACTLLAIPGLLISSTELRQRVKDGRSLRYLTPDAVAGYITKTGLYR